MKCAKSSYWKRNNDECIKQEFKGGLANLYSLEITVSKPTKIPLQIDMRDLHILYVLQAPSPIILHTASQGPLCSIVPERARHLYLPSENYEIELPAGTSHIFGFYYRRLIFRDGNDRSLTFISQLIEAHRNKHSMPLYSPDFRVGPRTHLHIRKLCRELRRGKLSNESFIFEQITKLIELSAEKVQLESAHFITLEERKALEARQLLHTYIYEEMGLPSLSSIAEEIGLTVNTLNQYHQHIYQCTLLTFRNELLISRAQVLLKEGYTTTQITYKLGYTGPSSFIRFFTQQVGSSPKAWLQLQQ